MHLIRIPALALSFLLSLLSVSAQTERQNIGYLRFWDMIPPQNGDFELKKMGEREGGATLLNGTAYRYSSYTQFPASRYHLGVFRKGDNANPIKVIDIGLQPNTFFTVIVAPKASAINVEVVNDTVDPKADAGTLTIRNYFPGITVSVATESQKITDALAYGETYAVTGLPSTRVQVTLKTKLPTGKPAESIAEPDFGASKKGTILIIPDDYGRFRPRATIDGKE